MSVDFEGYEGELIESAIALIAGSATFAALVEAEDDELEPEDRIIEIDGGMEDEASPMIRATNNEEFARDEATIWAQLMPDAPEFGRTNIAVGTQAASGMFTVAFYFRLADSVGYRHERLRYVISKTAKIRQEMEEQAGTAGIWGRVVARITNVSFLDTTGYGRGFIRSVVTVEYGDLA